MILSVLDSHGRGKKDPWRCKKLYARASYRALQLSYIHFVHSAFRGHLYRTDLASGTQPARDLPLAREAFLAFYSGYRASSISALIPAIEGSLTRIVSASGNELPIAAKVDRVIDRCIENAAGLHYDRMWVPEDYLSKDYLLGQDERAFAFEFPLEQGAYGNGR